MRLAIIDLGTNSVRFDVHQIGPGKAVRPLHREKIMVRLGQGVFTHGQLDPDAIRRTVHAFHSFQKIAADLRVSRMIALGTSALREAADGAKLVAKVKASTGIEVRVISGSEEAKLIALGILSNESIGKKRIGLIDIGGGSTEITVSNQRKILHSESFPLGTARLQQVFLKKNPPTAESIEQLREYIRSTLGKIGEEGWPRPATTIGSSGTIRALARILRKSNGKKNLKRKDLSELVRRMSRMNTTQLLAIEGMESKRVDMILAGGVLLEECLKALGATELNVTEFSLRDGILKEQVELAKQHATSQISLHLGDLVEKAVSFGGERRRVRATLQAAERLFKSLSGLHKLKPEWRMYLEAAAILRKTGEAVSLVRSPEHSYYLVRNARFPFIEEWESEFVAKLCLHHEEHRFDPGVANFLKNKSQRQAFLKLHALLSVLDALDTTPQSPLIIRRVGMGRGGVRVYFSGGSGSDLELYRIEQRKELFKRVFRRDFDVRRS